MRTVVAPRDHARQRGEAFGAHAVLGNSGQQGFAVRVGRDLEQTGHLTDFDGLTGIHHTDALCGFSHHSQVVRDQHQRHVLLFLQAQQQVHDLRLNGHVQRGGRFVGNQQLGLASDGHGNRHTLAHATRQLVRVGIQARGSARDFDLFQQLQRTLACCLA